MDIVFTLDEAYIHSLRVELVECDTETAVLPFSDLTDREREVLQLIAQGKNNSDIATQLHISSKTVSNYISVIFNKLQVSDRAQAIVKAREAGLGKN